MPNRETAMIDCFAAWLEAHADEFPVRLFPASPRRGRRAAEYRFVGVRRLRVAVHQDGRFMIWVEYRGKGIDALADFDLFPGKTPSGRYFCTLCKPRRYWKNKTAMLERHSFLPFLDWCKRKITPKSRLVMQGNRGVTWAEIIIPGKGKRPRRWKKSSFYAVESVISEGPS